MAASWPGTRTRHAPPHAPRARLPVVGAAPKASPRRGLRSPPWAAGPLAIWLYLFPGDNSGGQPIISSDQWPRPGGGLPVRRQGTLARRPPCVWEGHGAGRWGSQAGAGVWGEPWASGSTGSVGAENALLCTPTASFRAWPGCPAVRQPHPWPGSACAGRRGRAGAGLRGRAAVQTLGQRSARGRGMAGRVRGAVRPSPTAPGASGQRDAWTACCPSGAGHCLMKPSLWPCEALTSPSPFC